MITVSDWKEITTAIDFKEEEKNQKWLLSLWNAKVLIFLNNGC